MHPILFTIGSLPLHTFGVILAVAILVGSWLLARATKRLGDPAITEELMQKLVWYIVLAVIIGGRLMHVLVEHKYFMEHPLEIVAVWKGGLVLYGGLLGVFFVVLWFAWRNKISILRLCDLVAPSAFFGLGIGRWGCFMAGDDYGRPITDPVYGIHFPHWFGVRFTNPDALVPPNLRGVPLHPTEIYMSISAFIISGILFLVTRKKKFDGQIAGLAFVLYPLFRSLLIEPFRGDLDRGFVGPFSTAQFTSLFVLATGVLILWMAPRRLLADELADTGGRTAEEPSAADRPGSRKKGRRR